jgi:hypothetical protein
VNIEHADGHMNTYMSFTALIHVQAFSMIRFLEFPWCCDFYSSTNLVKSIYFILIPVLSLVAWLMQILHVFRYFCSFRLLTHNCNYFYTY